MPDVSASKVATKPSDLSRARLILALAELEEKQAASDRTVTELKDAIEELKHAVARLEKKDERRKDALEDVVDDCDLLKEEAKDIHDRLRDLETRADANENQDQSGSDVEDTEERQKRVEKLEASENAAADNNLKACIRSIFTALMGLAKSSSESLPDWPADEESWPIDVATGNRLIRFRWDKNYSDADNWKALQQICEHVKKKGSERLPEATEAIANISDNDLKDRVVRRFKDLAKNFRQAQKKRDAPLGANVQSANDAPGVTEGTATEVPPRALNKATKQARQKGREHLPSDSIYRDAKYDAAFAPTLMSEDEDDLDAEGKKTGRKFWSRPPAWRSDIMKNLLKAVDQVDDPKPNPKYTPRMQGATKDDPPPVTKLIKNRARQWMVSDDWLNNNKEYNISTRIAGSGKAWGDEEDPEELEEKKRKFKDEKEEVKHKKIKSMSAAAESKVGAGKKQKQANKVTRKGKDKADEAEGDQVDGNIAPELRRPIAGDEDRDTDSFDDD